MYVIMSEHITYHNSGGPFRTQKESAKQKHEKKVKHSVKDLQRIKPKFKANQQIKTCSAPPASLPCVSIFFFQVVNYTKKVSNEDLIGIDRYKLSQ